MQGERTKACLEKATECQRRAVLASDAATRKTYRDLAGQWRHMARQMEDLERHYPDWQFPGSGGGPVLGD
jgi:hypothetical protein